MGNTSAVNVRLLSVTRPDTENLVTQDARGTKHNTVINNWVILLPHCRFYLMHVALWPTVRSSRSTMRPLAFVGSSLSSTVSQLVSLVLHHVCLDLHLVPYVLQLVPLTKQLIPFVYI